MISFMYSHRDYDPFLGFVEVTGSEVNRRAGYGLKIPCINRLYGPKPYTDSTKTKVYSHSLCTRKYIAVAKTVYISACYTCKYLWPFT